MNRMVILASIIYLLNITNGSSDNCLVIYLNKLNLLDPFFGDIPKEYPNYCDSVIKTRKDTFDRDIFARLTAEDDQSCIIEKFNRYKIHNLFLKGKIYVEYRKTAIKNFTKEASESTADILQQIKQICTADKLFGMEFNNSLKHREKSRPAAKNLPIQNCLKKYFFEKKILDATEFEVDVSSIDATDCEEIYNELESAAPDDIEPNSLVYGLPSFRSQKCFFDKLQSENHLLRMASFGVALYMDLNTELIEKLRTRFIETRKLNLTFLLECLEKVMIVS